MMSVLLAALAAAAGVAQAAETPEIDTITVEAAKVPIAASDLASRVTLIGEDRLEAELAQNISDLVRYEPGVDVVDQGSRFGLSGISIRGVGGNRVKIEIDGVATADAFSIGSFSNSSRDFVDVASLKQVEIVRGPASSAFGSDALGGVVSFVTKDPQDVLGERSRHADLSVGYNGVDSGRVLAGTVAGRIGTTSAMLRANVRDGNERDVPGVDPLEDESLNVLGKLVFGDAAEGGLGIAIDRFEADSVTQVDSLERVQDFTAAFGFPYVIDTTRVSGDDTRSRARVSVGQEWLSGAVGTNYLRWRAYYQESETSQRTIEERETLIAGVPGAVRRDRRFEFSQDLYGLELNAMTELEFGGSDHQIAYGVEFELAETQQLRDGVELDLSTGESSNTVGPDTFPLRDFPRSDTTRVGAYLQNRITFGNVTLIPGVRWDRFELDPTLDDIFAEDNPNVEPVGISDERFSPKFGIVWRLSDRWQAYAQYSEGFRAPPANDVNVGFTNLQFGYTSLPNPDLESESSRGVEVGFRATGTTFSIDVSGYRTRYEDFIESFQAVGFDPVAQLLLFQSVNVDKVEIEGAELSAAIAPAIFPEGLTVRLAGAYANGHNRVSGAPLASIAPLNGVVALDYARPSGYWGASWIARGAQRQDDLDDSEEALLSPSAYIVFDAVGFWQPTEALRLRGGVYNIGDAAYTSYLDVQGIPADTADPDRFQRPGRHFSVALDYSF